MLKLRENIYNVGVRDGEMRIFHGYQTPIGTTYNAYLVVDEKVTLVDFVKSPFSEEFVENIREILGDRPIDYIVANHVEPDHSGALPTIVKLYPNAMVYGTANCQKGLRSYYPDSSYPFTVVKLGDSLNTGKYTFNFIPMPMVHWPDSMSTYLAEEKILFSNDAMGQHIGSGERIDTEIDLEKLLDRAGDYYANIVLPFNVPVNKLLESVSGYPLEMVCPSHGVVLNRYIPQIVEKYIGWSAGKVDDTRAVIVFESMWGTTRKLAERLSKELAEKGVTAELISLSEHHHSYAMARLLEAKYIYVGSPTLNNGMMPMVSAFLTYMKGLKPKNRIGRAFGSYGWSGESIPQINDILASCGFEMEASLKAQWNV